MHEKIRSKNYRKKKKEMCSSNISFTLVLFFFIPCCVLFLLIPCVLPILLYPHHRDALSLIFMRLSWEIYLMSLFKKYLIRHLTIMNFVITLMSPWHQRRHIHFHVVCPKKRLAITPRRLPWLTELYLKKDPIDCKGGKDGQWVRESTPCPATVHTMNPW